MHNFKHFFKEDAEKDRRFRAISQQYWNKVVQELQKYNENNFKNGIEIHSIKIPLLKDLTVFFKQDHPDEEKAIGEYDPKTNAIYLFNSFPEEIKDKASFMQNIDQDMDFLKTFIHEFIHYMDYKQYGTAMAKTNAYNKLPKDTPDEKKMKAYYNNPVEFSGHYQEFIHLVEYLIDTGLSKEQQITFFTKQPFKDFYDFFITTNRFGNVQKYLKDKYDRKFMKKIYSFWVMKRNELLKNNGANNVSI